MKVKDRKFLYSRSILSIVPRKIINITLRRDDSTYLGWNQRNTISVILGISLAWLIYLSKIKNHWMNAFMVENFLFSICSYYELT